jgi:hypothetical protein
VGKNGPTSLTSAGDLASLLRKTCTNRGTLKLLCSDFSALNYDDLAPRHPDGTPLDVTAPLDKLFSNSKESILLFPKGDRAVSFLLTCEDNFEMNLVNELTTFAWNNEPDKLGKMLELPCFQKVVNRVNSRGL